MSRLNGRFVFQTPREKAIAIAIIAASLAPTYLYPLITPPIYLALFVIYLVVTRNKK